MAAVLEALSPPAQPPAVMIRHGEPVVIGGGDSAEVTGVARRMPVRVNGLRPRAPYVFSSASSVDDPEAQASYAFNSA